MNEELLPCEVAISVVANQEPANCNTVPPTDRKPSLTKKLSNISDNFNSIINSAVGAAIVSSSAHSSSIIPSRRSSLVGRSRKKSRRLTLTQVCSEESPISHQNSSGNRPQLPVPADSTNYREHQPLQSASSIDGYDHPTVSRTASLISFSSVSSSSSSAVSSMSSSSSSSPKSFSQRSSTSSPRSSISSTSTHPERKINRIFSILHSMQQTFLQAQPFAAAAAAQQNGQQPQQPPSPQQDPQFIVMVPPRSTSVTTVHSDACRSSNGSVRPQRLHQPSRQHIYGMGRSQDSLVLAGPGSVNSHPNHMTTTIDRNRRFGSANSWAGSQCSGYTCTTMTTSTEATLSAPLVHATPYHKDGWTSLFIAGSSTYAQLLIVVCIVAALSEVVTHNVPFLYFEGFFTYLYTVSILFFLYVFGYLLRSKRRKEEKRRLRKLSKLRRAQMATNASSAEHEKDRQGSYRSNRSASIAMETEAIASTSTLNRFITGIRSQRRRFSRTGDGVSNLALEIGNETSNSLGNHDSFKSPNLPGPSKNLQWTPSSVGFNLVDESPSEIVSYAMNSDNVVIANSETGRNSIHHHHSGSSMNGTSSGKIKKLKVSDNEHSHGSFFLRAGAVAFGLGTMIYDGLEFGAFLEVPSDSPCFALLRGLNPVLHAAFVFLQMYFIFISARLNIHKFKAIARFGLMHCLATNVCVWIRTLVRESLKEINHHYDHHPNDAEKLHMTHQQHVASSSAAAVAVAAQHQASAAAADTQAFLHHVAEAVAAAVGSEEDGSASVYEFVNDTLAEALSAAIEVKSKEKANLWELTGNVSCGRHIFLGELIMKAAPFLYPFLIEYSLIGAGVLYVIWANIGLNPKYKTEEDDNEDSTWNSKSRQLRVDCVGASKGLFMGLFVLTAALLCLILFFIFAPQRQFHRLGLFLADSAHLSLLVFSLFAMAIGSYRARHLHFHSDHMEELGSILLRVSALGIFAYSVFSMIAGAFANQETDEPPVLVFINGLLSVVEVTMQMLFISDMSRRRVNTIEQDREKPGRQAVTFLLITNLTLWLVYTFEMQKVEANPVQLNFYGFLPWAIVQRITLPLCIFYRFHSAMVYAEIWKNSYRYHGPSFEEAMPQQFIIS
ncbi:hypothetical protein GHT06_012257 [Daphnia sinensis]|uniref:Uncharacterized protein n=1 Tax=Daphnia sinensis TaxID=1820382 RepID=A0AAD5PVI6_9CRUS|nr:hypothetical protein GHT06_012257 [Daphnia sinensis]